MMTNIGDQFLEKKILLYFFYHFEELHRAQNLAKYVISKKKDILKANFSRRKTHTRWTSRSFCGAGVGNKICWIWRRLFRSKKMQFSNFQKAQEKMKIYPNIGSAHPSTSSVRPTTPAKANRATAATGLFIFEAENCHVSLHEWEIIKSFPY